MSIIKNETLQSDQINILIGLEGTETKETIKWINLFKVNFPCRIVFAINQHYPELNSEHYCNKRLVALIQESLIDNGLYVVICDNYRNEGIVPCEPSGSLEIFDDYLLVDSFMNIHGRLNVWESTGGKGHFYHDQFIMEILSNEKICTELSNCLEKKCKIKSINCFKFSENKHQITY